MKQVSYRLHRSNPNDPDPERAVLPTIIYAKRADGPATVQILALGWWAWGIGIIRTVVKTP